MCVYLWGFVHMNAVSTEARLELELQVIEPAGVAAKN